MPRSGSVSAGASLWRPRGPGATLDNDSLSGAPVLGTPVRWTHKTDRRLDVSVSCAAGDGDAERRRVGARALATAHAAACAAGAATHFQP